MESTISCNKKHLDKRTFSASKRVCLSHYNACTLWVLMSQIIMHKLVLITKRVCLNKTYIQWLKKVDICSLIIKEGPKSFLSVAEFLVIMFIPFVLCKLRFNIVCFIAFRFGEGKWILYVRSVSSYKMKISLWCGSIHLVFHMLIISHSNQCPMTCFSMYIHILTE